MSKLSHHLPAAAIPNLVTLLVLALEVGKLVLSILQQAGEEEDYTPGSERRGVNRPAAPAKTPEDKEQPTEEDPEEESAQEPAAQAEGPSARAARHRR